MSYCEECIFSPAEQLQQKLNLDAANKRISTLLESRAYDQAAIHNLTSALQRIVAQPDEAVRIGTLALGKPYGEPGLEHVPLMTWEDFGFGNWGMEIDLDSDAFNPDPNDYEDIDPGW